MFADKLDRYGANLKEHKDWIATLLKNIERAEKDI